MPLTYGQPTNYQSPLVPIPSNMHKEPEEGRMQLPIEILWASMGGAGKIVQINLQENATLDLRQCSALIVDNFESAAPVTFIFPDTMERIVIPAGAKRAAFNVYTNGLLMIVSASTAIGSDVTRFQVLNYRIPPVYIP